MKQIPTLTHKQLRLLSELRAFAVREGKPPTVREIQDIMGFKSPRSVGQMLEALERAGYIRRSEGARNISILRNPPTPTPDFGRTIQVPVVGTAPAGAPLLAEQNITDYISISSRIARPPHSYFILRVVGDSMNKAGINDRDMVLVRQQPVAEDGQTVVALIDDKATIKRIRFFQNHIVLEPVSKNAKNRPIILEEDFQVQGVVIATLPKEGTK